MNHYVTDNVADIEEGDEVRWGSRKTWATVVDDDWSAGHKKWLELRDAWDNKYIVGSRSVHATPGRVSCLNINGDYEWLVEFRTDEDRECSRSWEVDE